MNLEHCLQAAQEVTTTSTLRNSRQAYLKVSNPNMINPFCSNLQLLATVACAFFSLISHGVMMKHNKLV